MSSKKLWVLPATACAFLLGGLIPGAPLASSANRLRNPLLARGKTGHDAGARGTSGRK
jgi:hypothetical protein